MTSLALMLEIHICYTPTNVIFTVYSHLCPSKNYVSLSRRGGGGGGSNSLPVYLHISFLIKYDVETKRDSNIEGYTASRLY